MHGTTILCVRKNGKVVSLFFVCFFFLISFCFFFIYLFVVSGMLGRWCVLQCCGAGFSVSCFWGGCSVFVDGFSPPCFFVSGQVCYFLVLYQMWPVLNGIMWLRCSVIGTGTHFKSLIRRCCLGSHSFSSFSLFFSQELAECASCVFACRDGRRPPLTRSQFRLVWLCRKHNRRVFFFFLMFFFVSFF